MKYIIIVTGKDCENYAARCIKSVLNQTVTTWEMFISSDMSTDRTNDILKSFTDKRIKCFYHLENRGAAFRRLELMKASMANDEDVFVLLDLDDELFPYSLETVTPLYNEGKLMTYGNWIDQRGFICDKSILHYSDEIWKSREFRSDKIWRCTHLKTFKAKLLKEIRENDFKQEGKWIDATTESPLGFALLELCGHDRIGIIEEPIYMYNTWIYGTEARVKGYKYIHDIYDKVRLLPKYKLYESS